MKRIISIFMAMALLSAQMLWLTSCKYDEPDEIKNVEEQKSPYGNYDYSKRAFFSGGTESACIYKGDVYYLSNYIQLMKASLNDLSCDLRTSKAKIKPKAESVCPEQSHNHNAFGTADECPAHLNDLLTIFLIDGYESAGDHPIVYYTKSWNADPIEEEHSLWDQSFTYHIYRYDTGKAECESIVETKNLIKRMMTYDQQVFFTTQNEKNSFQLNVVSKKGGDVTTISVGSGPILFLGVYNDQVIFLDCLVGAVYKAGLDLQNCEKIFQTPEVVETGMSGKFNGTFVHGNYLYFSADYEMIDYPINEIQTVHFMKHSLRRVPMDDLQGEGELVADNVYEENVYGVVDNVLYYTPCLPGDTVQGYYYNFDGGQLRAVDLATLKPVEIKEDTGISFRSNGWISGDGIISAVFPVKAGYNITFTDGNYICLYDIKTGALYPIYTT